MRRTLKSLHMSDADLRVDSLHGFLLVQLWVVVDEAHLVVDFRDIHLDVGAVAVAFLQSVEDACVTVFVVDGHCVGRSFFTPSMAF